MDSLILLIAVLVCPAVMGTMMLLMWRGMRHGHQGTEPPPPEAAERAHDSVPEDGQRAAAGPRSEVSGERR
jgi:hypothetical protein